LRERVGVRGVKKENAFKIPLILTFSLKGEGIKSLKLMAVLLLLGYV